MSEIATFLVLFALVFAPFLLASLWWNYKISKREDKPGDIIAEAREKGPTEMDEQVLEQKKRELHETERNILRLTERELLAYFGLGRVPRLGVEEIRHKMGEPVVQVVVYENILKWYGIPVGFERTRVRHYDFEIPIRELDEMMGEEVVAVDDVHGGLKAMGISAYEEEEYEDSLTGDTITERIVRKWNEDANNQWGVEYYLDYERTREVSESVAMGEEPWK